jgi:hypothetical protein
MSAKRFSSRSVMIVLLAIALVGGGCASLKPPILAPTQTVEGEDGGINLPSRAPAEEDLNPSGWKKTARVAASVLRDLWPLIALGH